MKGYLLIIVLAALLGCSACNRCILNNYSGVYLADRTFYDVNNQKYEISKYLNGNVVKHALYLKSDSTFSYRFLRYVWGEGIWHDNGTEIILDFIEIPYMDKGFSASYWYESATMILKKEGCKKLKSTSSSFKKIDLKNEKVRRYIQLRYSFKISE